MHDIGYVMTDRNPDYVVLGETRTYSFEAITKAIRLIENGARFIATNPDASGPSHQGTLPATGSVAALISTATGPKPYFVGKPNPLMMRSALNRIEAHSETTVMVGDRMDTDIVSGLEAGLRTILVGTGSTRPDQVPAFPYRPTKVVDSVADIVALVASGPDRSAGGRRGGLCTGSGKSRAGSVTRGRSWAGVNATESSASGQEAAVRRCWALAASRPRATDRSSR